MLRYIKQAMRLNDDGVKAPSRSKPNMAIVTMRNETRNDEDEVLQIFTVKMPVFKRPA